MIEDMRIPVYLVAGEKKITLGELNNLKEADEFHWYTGTSLQLFAGGVPIGDGRLICKNGKIGFKLLHVYKEK